MFNWFRRNEKAKQSETPAPETQPESVAESEASVETAEPDYLEFAKAAYQNIQEKKGASTAKPEAIAEDEVTVEETQADIVDITDIAEEEAEVDVDESVAESEAQPDEVAEPETTTKAPAWMQKSQGLEKLKETAIPSPEAEAEVKESAETELDEDFIWSSQVLAKSGRTAEDVSEEEISWLTKLRQGLGKTRIGLVNQLKSIVGKGPLNDNAVTEIESLLLQADVGIEATDYIIETLQAKLKEEVLPPDLAIAYLKAILQDILDKPLADKEDKAFVPEKEQFNIWLLTGVNGAGKTTTIGKLANLGQKSGYSCMIAAADTFRAAAVQQVKVWGERTNTQVIANPGQNTDPASVVFDANRCCSS